jgi:hypothetical protein
MPLPLTVPGPIPGLSGYFQQADERLNGTRRRIGGFELQIWQVSSRLGLPACRPACQQLTPDA